MTCLITGDRGFVGSNLVSYLTARGYNTIGFDMLMDYPTVEVLEEFMRQNNVTKIYHLGARAFIPSCYGTQISSIVNSNVVFTANLLTAAEKINGFEKLVYLSTSEVYGNTSEPPMNENTPVNPVSTYAATKLAAENLIRTFRTETGLDCRILRHFNIYGPRDTQPRIIPKLMQSAKHGFKIKLGDITVTRDFSYVMDACEALENVLENTKQEDFVKGNDSEWSILDLIDVISEIYGKPVRYELDSYLERPAEVKRLRSDSSKYHRYFPLHKSISLAEGLKYTKEWYDTHDWKWENGKSA